MPKYLRKILSDYQNNDLTAEDIAEALRFIPGKPPSAVRLKRDVIPTDADIYRAAGITKYQERLINLFNSCGGINQSRRSAIQDLLTCLAEQPRLLVTHFQFCQYRQIGLYAHDLMERYFQVPKVEIGCVVEDSSYTTENWLHPWQFSNILDANHPVFTENQTLTVNLVLHYFTAPGFGERNIPRPPGLIVASLSLEKVGSQLFFQYSSRFIEVGVALRFLDIYALLERKKREPDDFLRLRATGKENGYLPWE